MTASTIALAELAEKGADVDVLRQMVQFMSSTFGCGTHGDRHQAVVRRSVDALDECRLSGEQPPVSRHVPHHHYL